MKIEQANIDKIKNNGDKLINQLRLLQKGNWLRLTTASEAMDIRSTVSRAMKESKKKFQLQRDGDDVVIYLK